MPIGLLALARRRRMAMAGRAAAVSRSPVARARKAAGGRVALAGRLPGAKLAKRVVV